MNKLYWYLGLDSRQTLFALGAIIVLAVVLNAWQVTAQTPAAIVAGAIAALYAVLVTIGALRILAAKRRA